eukprot:gb/GFBE01025109.1/.p1 GENE.gb/GFBE01025109.1/~~gb/GFBE01025109.1/.p1  ORF type:complete len:344 (+),score=72.33 gb/GFBE01025109.1/:1-1032(+)
MGTRSNEQACVPQKDIVWYHEWVKENIPDQTGRVAIVTGSNSGTGFWAAAALAGKGATVVLACRSEQKAQAAKDEILSMHPKAKIDVIKCDNMELSTVRTFAADFKKKYNRLDLLLNNAGIMSQPLQKSADGHDVQFQTNHLAHFLLTALLWDLLKNTGGDVRVVQHSSVAHWMGGTKFDRTRMDLPTYSWAWILIWPLLGCMGYTPQNWRRYAMSKLCNVLFGLELQRRIDAAGCSSKVKSVMCHPGYASTQLQKYAGDAGAMPGWQDANIKTAQSAADGSLPLLMACFANIPGGSYTGPSGKDEMTGPPTLVEFGGSAKDEAMARDLWAYSEDQVGVKFNV